MAEPAQPEGATTRGITLKKKDGRVGVAFYNQGTKEKPELCIFITGDPVYERAADHDDTPIELKSGDRILGISADRGHEDLVRVVTEETKHHKAKCSPGKACECKCLERCTLKEAQEYKRSGRLNQATLAQETLHLQCRSRSEHERSREESEALNERRQVQRTELVAQVRADYSSWVQTDNGSTENDVDKYQDMVQRTNRLGHMQILMEDERQERERRLEAIEQAAAKRDVDRKRLEKLAAARDKKRYELEKLAAARDKERDKREERLLKLEENRDSREKRLLKVEQGRDGREKRLALVAAMAPLIPVLQDGQIKGWLETLFVLVFVIVVVWTVVWPEAESLLHERKRHAEDSKAD